MAKQKKTLEERIEAKKNAIKNHCKRVHVSYDEVMTMFYELYEKYHKEYVKACEQFKEERSLFFEELKSIPFLKRYQSPMYPFR